MLVYPALANVRKQRRALATNSSAWRVIRSIQLTREPLCRACAQRGRATVASDVDHIDSRNTSCDQSNLQSLCHSCHSSKTAREDGGFGNRSRGTY